MLKPIWGASIPEVFPYGVKGEFQMRRISAALAALIGFIFLLASPAYAQETLGSINGTVKDSSGGVVAGASVKARNVATNLEQNTTTKDDGSFSLCVCRT